MEINAYNLENQKLHSNELLSVLNFCSNKYAGAIYCTSEDNPLTISGTEVSINEENLDFLLSGFLIKTSNFEVTSTLSEENNLYGMVVDLGSIKAVSNITTNNILEQIHIGTISGFTVKEIKELDPAGIESIKYEIKNGNDGWDDYRYDTKQFSSLTVAGSTYTGELYLIPFAGFDTDNNKVIPLLGYLTKSSLEEFLTEAARKAMEELFNNRFVWRAGGIDIGNIGDLNITDSLLSSPTKNLIEIGDDNDIVKIKGVTLDLSNGAGALYKENENSGITIGTLPINQGGTGATTKNDEVIGSNTIRGAKYNLGFFSGIADPSTSLGENGDIYFKILED